MKFARRPSLASQAVLAFLWMYRHCVSPFKPCCCRFSPTCSTYARDAVRRHGFFRGGWMSFKRLLRCHPFYKGSLYDPVPEVRERVRKAQSGSR